MRNRFLLVVFGLVVLLGVTAPLHAQPYERVIRDTVSRSSGSVSIENEEGQYQGAVQGGGPLLRVSSVEGRIEVQRR